MNNELLLLSGADIPFIEAGLSIHQPTLKEISLIGEEDFFFACQFLNFSKDIIPEEDRKGLEDKSNFDIFMSIVCDKNNLEQSRKYKASIEKVLTLLFPTYQLKWLGNEIILFSEEGSSRINGLNFESFKDILDSMFILTNHESSKEDYNPANTMAERIAEKLKKGKEKIAQIKNGTSESSSKVAILSRYASILAVGEKKDLNNLMDYTVFQLKDEFKRFEMKQAYDMNIKARMAGATDLDDVDNWMEDIHP